MTRTRLALALWLALLGGCADSRPPEERFWSWFEEDAGRLAWATGIPGDSASDAIAEALAQVHPDLRFELEGEPGRARRLVLSAQGKRHLAPLVTALERAAPLDTLAQSGWSLHAFRPRLGADVAIDFRGFVLEPADLWFAYEVHPAEPDQPEIKLELRARGIGEAEDALAREAAALLVHAAIGERAALERIATTTFRPLPPDPVAAGLLPLGLLNEIVAEVHGMDR